jgi:hypothetical protein
MAAVRVVILLVKEVVTMVAAEVVVIFVRVVAKATVQERTTVAKVVPAIVLVVVQAVAMVIAMAVAKGRLIRDVNHCSVLSQKTAIKMGNYVVKNIQHSFPYCFKLFFNGYKKQQRGLAVRRFKKHHFHSYQRLPTCLQILLSCRQEHQ